MKYVTILFLLLVTNASAQTFKYNGYVYLSDYNDSEFVNDPEGALDAGEAVAFYSSPIALKFKRNNWYFRFAEGNLVRCRARNGILRCKDQLEFELTYTDDQSTTTCLVNIDYFVVPSKRSARVEFHEENLCQDGNWWDTIYSGKLRRIR